MLSSATQTRWHREHIIAVVISSSGSGVEVGRGRAIFAVNILREESGLGLSLLLSTAESKMHLSDSKWTGFGVGLC